ncbi:VOC family protein [Silvimonas sp. JCM 19000]
MQVQPYLMFEGRCEEAITFYTQAIGAQLQYQMRYSDNPEPMPEGQLKPGMQDKIMHAAIQIGDSVVLASDGHCAGSTTFGGVLLTLNVADQQEAEQKFAALSAGGQVTMPLTQTFFSPAFGMLTDRFGLGWMVIVPQAM